MWHFAVSKAEVTSDLEWELPDLYACQYYSTRTATIKDRLKRLLALYKAKRKAMPTRCVAASCSTSTGEGYSLHEFPRDTAHVQNGHGLLNIFEVTGMDLRQPQCFAPNTSNLNAS